MEIHLIYWTKKDVTFKLDLFFTDDFYFFRKSKINQDNFEGWIGILLDHNIGRLKVVVGPTSLMYGS